MQNYYDVLGVSPTADDFVIKAAYKALAQRYHPDKFANNPRDAADAENKMRQLNEAYQILSDTAKRCDYDASLKQNQQQNSQQSSANSKQQADWQIALRFYPDLTSFETRLAKFDSDLVTEFRSNLLATQQYERRQAIADKLEQDYLEGYFGDHPDIVEFARELLLAGKREGAKELNQMLKVVGASVPASEIIMQLANKHMPENRSQTCPTKRTSNLNIDKLIRWDVYLKRYNCTRDDLTYAILHGKIKSELVNEQHVDDVLYVENKKIDGVLSIKLRRYFDNVLMLSFYIFVTALGLSFIGNYLITHTIMSRS
jgi:curved DNA-binding protein CbpA